MLHTKFRRKWSTGSGEEVFKVFFYHICAWRLSWSYDPDAVNKFSFSVPKKAP